MPLVWFPSSSSISGHPWKVELVISFYLLVVLLFYLTKERSFKNFPSFKTNEIWRLLVPFVAFIVWSAASSLWANSLLSVIHHTLLWSVYFVFFCFIAKIANFTKYLQTAIASLTVAVVIIALCCILESSLSAKAGMETFGFRYGRFAEIFACVLPLLFALSITAKKKVFWQTFLLSAVWLAVLLSVSRSSFLSAVVGLSVFILLRIASKICRIEKKRIITVVIILISAAVLVHLPALKLNNDKQTTFSRIATQESGNSFSNNVRFLFSAVGIEMVSAHPLTGVGADNYGLEFNKYFEIFSLNNKNEIVRLQQEIFIPERAHNEYLQIVAELGLVGGIIFLFFLFGIAKLGLQQIKIINGKPADILSQAAAAGIVTFLFSSLFTSFSFRLAQNGLVFFFLLALLLRKYFIKSTEKDFVKPTFSFGFSNYFGLAAIILCAALMIFSSAKAASQYLVYQAEQQKDLNEAELLFKKAELLDLSNASANYSFGLRLLTENRFKESSYQFQKAIDKGFNTIIPYSYLISAQTLANNYNDGKKTAAEAVGVFPYSVFMRVRYAVLLRQTGNNKEADKQFEIAEKLNSKQADAWQILISQGAMHLNEKSKPDHSYLAIDELKPQPAVDAVIAEREIRFPDEKSEFKFIEN